MNPIDSYGQIKGSKLKNFVTFSLQTNKTEPQNTCGKEGQTLQTNVSLTSLLTMTEKSGLWIRIVFNPASFS
jgi:hypothetical protein